MDRNERLLDLAALLLGAARPVPFAELQDAFPDDYGGVRESAERKFERDKAELVGLGLPLKYVQPTADGEDEATGYVIDRDAYYLPDLRLAPDELAALYAAGAAALAGTTLPFRHELALALRKVAFSGGEPAATAPGARRLVLAHGEGDDAGRSEETLELLSRAAIARRTVHLVYFTPGRNEETARDVDPYGVLYRRGAWVMAGYCHLRRGVRVFHLARVRRATAKLDGPPQFDVPTGFSVRAHAALQPWELRKHASIDAVLELSADAEVLAERRYGKKPERTPDGRWRITLPTTFSDALVRDVLSHEGSVTLVAPPELVRAARETALRIATLPDPAPLEPLAAARKRPARRDEPAPRETARKARLKRLLVLIPDLARHPGTAVEAAAARLGITPRELTADIEKLAMIGRPPFNPDDLIEATIEDGRIYVELAQSFSRPPRLTVPEALALAAAAQLVSPADGAAARAAEKLTSGVAPALRELFTRLAERVGASETDAPAELLETLRTAAATREEVEIDYYTEARGASERRRVRPYAVVLKKGRWYLDAYCLSRQADRIFRVDHIREVARTGATFADPGPLDARRYESGGAGGLFFPSPGATPVKLRFAPGAASWAKERFGASALDVAGGAVDVTLESAGTRWPISLALSFGGEVDVVAPESLRAELRAAARRLAEAHAESGK